jgi:hypothetical protein
MTRRGRLLPSVVLCAAALAGCGDSGSSSGDEETSSVETTTVEQVSGPPARVIRRAQTAVDTYCRRVAEALGEGRGPTPADFERVSSAIDQLVALAAQRPQATDPIGTTPRLALGDIAENLEGANCDPRLVERIDAALATLPPG